jgi:hypothetical protein
MLANIISWRLCLFGNAALWILPALASRVDPIKPCQDERGWLAKGHYSAAA